MTKKKLCIKVEVEDQFPVTVEQNQDSKALFTVTYGEDIQKCLSYAKAAQTFGECVFHALACNGELNNEGE